MDKALPAFIRPLLASDVIGRGIKNIEKIQKKSLPKISGCNKPPGHTTRKGVDELVAVSLQFTLHTKIPST
jgi:hypothetical protein